MWQAFLKAHQQASSTPDALFHRLRKAKIKAISVEHCQQVIHALTLLTKSQHHGFFYLSLHQALHKARKEMPSQSLNESLQSLQHILHIAKAGKANIEFYQRLESSEFWSAQFQAVRHDRGVYHKMILLHRHWLKKSRYAIYSTQGLVWVYHTVLPVFTQWLDYAHQELTLKQAKLDRGLTQRYQRFLKQLDLELQLEKQQLREALYQRLRMGLAFHIVGVEYWVLGFIAEINTVKEMLMDEKETNATTNNSSSPTCIPAVVFQQASHILEKDGTSGEKTLFYALPHYHGLSVSIPNKISDKTQPYRCSHLGKIYRIPRMLTELIPLELPFYFTLPTWLHFLFWGDQVRYHFFQHSHSNALLAIESSSEFFSQCKLLNDIPLQILNTHSNWTYSTTFFTELAEEQKRCQSALARLSWFFHHTNYQILKGYETWLKITARRALQQQITQFKTYITENKTRNVSFGQTMTEQKQFATLLDELATQDRQWCADFWSELASLRLEVAQFRFSPTSVPASEAKFISEPKLIFDQLYAALFRVIQAWEGQINLMPEKTQSAFNTLKQDLKNSETIRHTMQLYANMQACLKKLSKAPLFERLTHCHRDLTMRLQTLLSSFSDQKIMASCAYGQIAQSKRLDHSETHIPHSDQKIFSQNIEVTVLVVINNPLSRLDEVFPALQSDIKKLATYRHSDISLFKYQVKGYVYQVLSAFSALSSKETFETKLPLFRQILSQLQTISQGIKVLEELLAQLLQAEKNLSEPMYQRWNYFVENHFKVVCDILAEEFPAFDKKAKESTVTKSDVESIVTENQTSQTVVKPHHS